MSCLRLGSLLPSIQCLCGATLAGSLAISVDRDGDYVFRFEDDCVFATDSLATTHALKLNGKVTPLASMIPLEVF
jgi:hypothetical protein